MFKKYFSAGLLFWLPLAITVWILNMIVDFGDHLLNLLPPSWRLGFEFPGFGLILGFCLILCTGLIVANLLGQKLVRLWESLLEKIPVVRPIYSGVKQIANTLLSQQERSFEKAVLIQFPQPGQWTLGLIVKKVDPKMASLITNEPMLTVFVPTAPNPTSGYVVMVRQSEVKETNISVDEAFKFHVSLGVVTPNLGNSAEVSLEKSTK